jgi:2-keto-4-pentenoate hydratase/2-oxohepta-3-ene-1,7-dioic acid hydratase in catechol pathway
MKLLRVGAEGRERPAVVDASGILREMSAHVPDWSGSHLDPERLAALRALDLTALPQVAADARIGAPISGIGKIVAVGLNYADHAAESGMQIPSEPMWFLKATSSISGPFDAIVIPRGAAKMDWEVELAVVIGRKASYVSEGSAMSYVAGYMIINDVTERAFQIERGTQWTKGKSCDSFGPMGPWLVTTDEVTDPHDLRTWLDVNGVRQQSSRTSQMIFRIPQLIASISGYMTLYPGDVIATGTPAGVGYSKKPQRFLRPGDVVELGIDKLGSQRQTVVARSTAA